MTGKDRVISYIDGYNLYFGLKSSGWKRYYWLDVCKLSEELTLGSQELLETKYFTSRIGSPPDKRVRQNLYLEALQAATPARIIYGKYTTSEFKCPLCKGVDKVPKEKMTDVNIATEMLADAFQDRFDTALLITADSDLTAPVEAIRRIFPNKRVVVGFPPNRASVDLKNSASAFLHINKARLAASLLPPEVLKPDGYRLTCPAR